MAAGRGLDVLMTVAARFGGKTINLFVFLILARTLPVLDMGIYGYIFSITLILSTMLDLGVRNSLAVYVGADGEKRQQYTRYAFQTWMVLSVTTIPAIHVSFYLSGMDILRWEYLIPSIVLLVSMLYLRMLQGVLLGSGGIAAYNRTELASRVVLLVLTIVLLILKQLTLLGALWVLAASQFAAALYLFAGQLGDIRGGGGGTWRLAWGLVSRGFLFMVSVLEMNLSKRLAFLAVSYFASAQAAGIFFTLQRLTEIITEVGLAVSVVIFSHNVRAKSSEEAVQNTAHSMRICFMVFVIICVVFALTAPWSVPFLLGQKYAGNTELFLIILAGTLVGSVWTVLFPSLSVATSPATVFWLMMPGLLLNSVLIYPFMMLDAERGAAWSMVVANLVLTGSFLWLYKRRFGVGPSSFLMIQASDLQGLKRRIKGVSRKR